MKKRISNLDLFRFFAIVLVIYYHTSLLLLPQYFPDKRLYMIGELGVELFFVLSGFLVAGLYYKVKNNAVGLKVFWLKRFLRTYPPYLVAFIISYLLVYFHRNESFDFGYLLFLQNFHEEISFFKISWSLCIEEHFYLFFVLFIFLTTYLKKNQILVCWILLCFLSLAFRFSVGSVNSPDTFNFFVTATIFKMDGLVIGSFLAYLINNYEIKYKSGVTINIVLLTSLILIGYWLSANYTFFKYTIGYFIFILNSAFLMISLYYSPPIKISEFKMVKRIALMAYSLYLTHAWVINIFIVIRDKYYLSDFVVFGLSIIAIFIVGHFFYHIIEKPSILLRNRFLK